MTSTHPYTAAATQARQATEKSIEVWRNSAKTLTDQFDQVRFPTVDLTEPVARYFEFLQRAVDFNRDLATRWAELVTSMSGSVREQAAKVTSTVTDQTNTIADLTGKQAKQAEEMAKKQAHAADRAKREQKRRIDDTKREQAGQSAGAEDEQSKKDHQKAREPYAGLTKSELTEQLAERGLPRSGNVDELIERLVGADSE